MTVLTAINEVCDVVSLDRFVSVYGSNNPAAQTMLELAKLAGQEIAERFAWKALQRSDTASVSPYPFPADYDRLIEGGAVFTAVGDFARPVKSPSQWAVVLQVPSTQPYYYLSTAGISFSPAGDAVGATITYVSKNWILGSTGTEKADWTAEDDVAVFPERLLVLNLIWRWKRQKGLNYDDPLAEFEAALAAATEEDRG